jgi:hypothetical protein
MKNKDKKFVDFENPMDALATFTQMMGTPVFNSFFGGMPFTEAEKYPYDRLGNGYELRPIELKDVDGNIVENRDNYSHLYHNELKVSDLVFRKGGMGGNFKDGYCSLIHYTQKEPHTEKRHGFNFGIHVIINRFGDIKLSGTGISSYPSYYGKNIGKLGDTFYDLQIGKEVLTCSGSNVIDGLNYIIVEHRYDWYNKELPLGVYKIDKEDCTFEKIDDSKK